MRSVPSRSRAPAVAATLLALSLGAAACGGSDADESVGAAASDAAEVAESAPDGPVLDASVFSGEATTLDGASFDLTPLAGQDLIVWFWAPW